MGIKPEPSCIDLKIWGIRQNMATTTTSSTTHPDAIEKIPSIAANVDDHASVTSVHTAVGPVMESEVTMHGW